MPHGFVSNLISLAAATAVVVGCSSGLDRLDREVEALLLETSDTIGERYGVDHSMGRRAGRDVVPASRDAALRGAEDPLDTLNPAAADLSFTAAGERDAQAVIDRLQSYSEASADALHLDLAAALAYAVENGRDYRFAEETYVLAVMGLLIERHLWGPRLFDDIRTEIAGSGDDGLYDSSLRVVNDLGVTQRLPYGGEVSARLLATLTEDLHRRVSGENVQSADIVLDASIPLLRGAGLTAREDRIQAERDVVYAARDFARFRRQYLFDIAREYLDLVVSQRRLENEVLRVESFRRVEAEQESLYRAGRSTPFDAAEAKNRTFESIDDLNSARESDRLAIDRFKVTIGVVIHQPLEIAPDSVGLPTPIVDMDEAVLSAMTYRLDLQTRRDELDDARRRVANARNDLLGDLNLTASVAIPTTDDKNRAGLDFELDDTDYIVGITYGVPLDRKIEQLRLRESQIALVRAVRSYDTFRDEIGLSVRGAVRGIDSALFSLQIQKTNVEIAERREESINADKARADIRQRTEAISATFRARIARDRAERDLEVAIMNYLLVSGQLRVDGEGFVEPLDGMEISRDPDR